MRKTQRIRSLNLSVAEIASLLSIDDPEERRRVLDTFLENAASPDGVDPEHYSAEPSSSHPMTICLARKINRRIEQRRRRAQARQRRAEAATTTTSPAQLPSLSSSQTSQTSQTSPTAPTALPDLLTLFATNPPVATLNLDRSLISTLLWLHRNHHQWMSSFFGIFEALTGSPIPAAAAKTVRTTIATLHAYILPLIDYAASYCRIPVARRRPSITLPPSHTPQMLKN